jgi:two-component system NtrC family response regulator
MSATSASILILDDEQNYLLVLQSVLEDEGYAVTALSNPEMGLAFLDDSEVDVVVTDMKMPGLTGQDVLEYVKKNHPHVPVLIMTAFGSIESAVEAMRIGAFDYITKPFDNEELLLSLKKAVSFARTQQENLRLRAQLQEHFGEDNIIGRGKAMQHVLSMVHRAAPSKSTVLISGESGTGKELIARAIHNASPRKDEPFVSVNCAALNSGVLESELFGHEKGSFTGATAQRKGRFEQANKGTLFLDEIGEINADTQVKLLRVLQERTFERVGGVDPIEVDIRVVAATNKDLAAEVEAGRFREDLFYRLNVVSIEMPPLRERREDIPVLAAFFLEKFSKENNAALKGFSASAMDYLTSYEWPGNVRQLENVIERCTVLAMGETLDAEDLPPEIKDEESQYKSAVDLLPVKLDLADTMEKIEGALVRRALVRGDFVQVKAAELLSISKSLLQYKMKKYKLSAK